ncbi:MAG: shikimate dehydrogenase [Coriobacteriia bacterium]|nr:shikimate dehydrogenase [Coriobacteriia bacterium]
MSRRIGARTKLAGVVGWPLGHTLSPAMHNAAYEALGLDWVYLSLPVPEEGHLIRVFGCLKVLPFVGVNVTMPYKQAALVLCDEVAMQAQMAGAVNTVHVSEGRLIGYNTDGRGLLEALSDAGVEVAGKRIALIGAGGAAGAAFVGFVLARAASIAVLNRSVRRAEELVERMRPHLRDTAAEVLPLAPSSAEAVRTADLVVNATSVGMRADEPSPVPVEWLHAGHVVCDVVYRGQPTALLAAAKAAGATTVDGLQMLVRQGAIAIDIWSENTTAPAPRDVMLAAAREAAGDSSDRGAEQ